MFDSITVVAADDHSMFLEGIKSLLEKSPRYKLLGTAECGDGLLSLIDQYKPDIALVDLSMPGAKTSEIISSADSIDCKTQLIALTMHLEVHLAKTLLELGLSGYVLKESAFNELIEAIDCVYAGDQFLSPAMVDAMKTCNIDDLAELSPREQEVLTRASLGKSNKEIARGLDISERTVRFHISNCCIKLDAQGRASAVVKALKQGYIS